MYFGHLAIFLYGLILLANLYIKVSYPQTNSRVFWILLDHLFVFGNGLVKVSFLQQLLSLIYYFAFLIHRFLITLSLKRLSSLFILPAIRFMFNPFLILSIKIALKSSFFISL